jgi:hypothetical protein
MCKLGHNEDVSMILWSHRNNPIHNVFDVCVRVYCFAIMHLRAFCIENASTLVAISSCAVAIGLTLVGNCSRRVAIRSLVATGSYML